MTDKVYKVSLLVVLVIGISSYVALNRYEFVSYTNDRLSLPTAIVCDRLTGEVNMKIALDSKTLKRFAESANRVDKGLDQQASDTQNGKTVFLTPVAPHGE